MSREELAERQAALVAALVADGEIPPGFDQTGVRAARLALLRKRADEVAAAWPALRASCGPQWSAMFHAFAAARPPAGSLRDGWDFARWAVARGELRDGAAAELATREATWRYDGNTPPRRRRGPAVKRAGTATAVQLAGRTRVVWRSKNAGGA